MRIGISAPQFSYSTPDALFGSVRGSASFAISLLSAESVSEADLFAVSPAHARELQAILPELCAKTQTVCTVYTDLDILKVAKERNYSVFFHLDLGPRVGYLSAIRRGAGLSFQIVALAHSLSTNDVEQSGISLLASDLEARDAIVCPSSSAARALRKLLISLSDKFPALRQSEVRVVTVPFAVDTSHFHPGDAGLARRRLGFDPDVKLLLVVGRLDAAYKQDLDPLIAAVRPLLEDCPDRWNLVLAGRATQRQLRRLSSYLSAYGLERSVRVIPNVQENVKPILYQAADVFLAPFDGMQESFGIAVVEAMSTGLPVVASAWDGLRETVTAATGVLVSTSLPVLSTTLVWPGGVYDEMRTQFLHSQATVIDVSAFRAGVQRLMNSASLRSRMGRSARKRVEEHFTHRTVSRLIDDSVFGFGGASPFEVPNGDAASEILPAARAGSRWQIFNHYAENWINGETIVGRTDRNIRPLELITILDCSDFFDGFLDVDRADSFLDLAETPHSIADISRALSQDGPYEEDIYLACWLMKHGLLEPRVTSPHHDGAGLERIYQSADVLFTTNGASIAQAVPKDANLRTQADTATFENNAAPPMTGDCQQERKRGPLRGRSGRDRQRNPFGWPDQHLMLDRTHDIYIVGLGIRAFSQITFEVFAALRASNVVFLAHTDRGVREYLAAQGMEVKELGHHWHTSSSPRDAHEAIAQEVILEATHNSPVSFAVYGHPKILVRPTRLIKQAALHLDLSVKILPAVSSLDCMLIDLDIEPGESGLTIVEMRQLIRWPSVLSAHTAAIAMQVGKPLADGPFAKDKTDSADIAQLRSALLEIHSPNHRVALINSSTDLYSRPKVFWTEVSELPSLTFCIDLGTSLFIPPRERSSPS